MTSGRKVEVRKAGAGVRAPRVKREERSLRGGVEGGGKLGRRGLVPVTGQNVGNGRGEEKGVGRVTGRFSCEGECPGGGGKKFFLPVNEGGWCCEGSEQGAGEEDERRGGGSASTFSFKSLRAPA